MKAKIVQHQRGNHSDSQILEHGRTIFEGTVSDVKKEMTDMRKMCRRMWRERSTEQCMSDYVSYEMADVWAFKLEGDNWVRL